MKKEKKNKLKMLFIFILLTMLSVSIYIANNSTKIINGKKKISLLAQDGDVTWDISETESDNVTATLSVDGTLTISGSGEMKDLIRWGGVPWYESRELIKTIQIETGITNISREAFYYCTNLTSIKIPESVTSIGDKAFESCFHLTSIKIPESVTSIGEKAFEGCRSLTSINIPVGVTAIKNNTFRLCRGLTSIEISEGVTNIGGWAFDDCSNLTSVEIKGNVTTIGEYAFRDCRRLTKIEIPKSVTNIGKWAFNRCSNLTSIEIPEGVTSIGEGTFDGCSSLTSIEIPESITSIADSTFFGCSSLTSIEIPEGVASIENRTFYGCSSLTSIEIPESVTSIEGSAFFECSSLISIEIPEGVTSIGNYAFKQCSSLTSIKIPSGVTNIGKYAFNKCSSLTSIEIPSGVTSIEDFVFSECYNITSMQIPENVTNIGEGALSGCYSLTSIKIPSGVTNIGKFAFNKCSSLTSIEIPSGVTSIGEQTFAECTNLKNVKLPNSIHSVCKNAFYGCSSISQIDIAPRIGYQIEWYENEKFTGDKLENLPVNSNENIMLYAKWAPIEYTITYDLAGGSLPQGKSNPATYNIETENFTLNNPTKTGYTFTGWTGSNGTTKQTQVSVSKGSMGDKEYTANWKANTYTITYNGNGVTGGNTAKSTHEYDKEKALTANGFTNNCIITYNHNYQGSQDQTREYNVSFSKWNTKADGTGTDYEDKQVVKNLTTRDGENINLYAQWANITYVPERTGYTFAGWYANSNLTGERVDKQKAGSYIPTSSIILYAKWTPIEYTITYNLAGGNLPQGKSNPATYNIETENFTLNNPTKTGYTFTGWTGSNGTTKQTQVTISKGSTGDKSYTANWNINKYTVVFKDRGNTAKTEEVEHGKAATAPVIEREGYTLSWDKAFNNITTAITVNAVWTPIEYTIQYNLNEGTNSTKNPSIYTVESIITLEDASKPGNTFDGWYETPKFTGNRVTTIQNRTGTITLYAKFTVNTETYIIEHYKEQADGTYERDDEETESKSGTVGTEVTATAKTFTGYTYDETNSNNKTNGVIPIQGQLTLKLYYTRNNSTVTFILNNGNANIVKTQKWGTELTAPTELEKEGYALNGWDTEIPTTMPIENKTYTANWTPVEYTISYNLDGGQIAEGTTNPATYNIETESFTLNNPTKTGYTFIGWTGANGETPQTDVRIEKGSLGNKSYTANWQENLVEEMENENYKTKKNGEETYLIGILPDTTIQYLVEGITTNASKIEMIDNKEEKVGEYERQQDGSYKWTGVNGIKENEKRIGTGYKIKISLNEETVNYTAVVTGDLNGDGEMTDSDLMRIARYIAKLDTSLTGAYLEAADIHKDGKLAQDSDLMKMARVLVNLDRIK